MTRHYAHSDGLSTENSGGIPISPTRFVPLDKLRSSVRLVTLQIEEVGCAILRYVL